MWLFSFLNYLYYLKLAVMRSYIITKTKCSKEYRIAKSIKKRKLNALNSYNIYMHYNFPFENVQHFFNMLSEVNFEMNKVNYDAYEKLTSNTLSTKSCRSFFNINADITEESMSKHEVIFATFLETYMSNLIKIALYNYDHGDEHIYTKPFLTIGGILSNFDLFYKKMIRAHHIRQIRGWLALS